MQQELIEMLDKMVKYVVICNEHDQRFSSSSYGVNILKEAKKLVEKAKNSAKEPAVPQGGSSLTIQDQQKEWADYINRCDSYDPPDRRHAFLAGLARGRTLAAPSKEPAVPGGLPERETQEMHDAVMAVLYNGVGRTETDKLWQAYRAVLLDAAPSQEPVTAPSLISPNAVWLIHYDDADRRPEILTSEQAARAYFKRISGQWNAHLFVKVESNSRDDRFYSLNASMATAPAQEPVTLTESEIISVKKASKASDQTKPWGDSIAFAEAIIAALREKEGK